MPAEQAKRGVKSRVGATDASNLNGDGGVCMYVCMCVCVCVCDDDDDDNFIAIYMYITRHTCNSIQFNSSHFICQSVG